MTKLKYRKGDLLSESFEVELGNRRLVAHREGPDIYFATADPQKVRGRIYVGSPRSGAIYVDNDCIAEFDKTDDRYIIRPVSGGRRDPHLRLERNPVEYLFDHLFAGKREASRSAARGRRQIARRVSRTVRAE